MPALLRIRQVEQRLGIKTTTIYDRIKKGLLPAPVKYGAHISLWPEDEIDACRRAIVSCATPAEMRQLVTQLVGERRAA